MSKQNPIIHLCSWATVPEVRHEFEGKICLFEFSEMFGPLFLKFGDLEPRKIQPVNPECWSWRAFGDWFDNVYKDGEA